MLFQNSPDVFSNCGKRQHHFLGHHDWNVKVIGFGARFQHYRFGLVRLLYAPNIIVLFVNNRIVGFLSYIEYFTFNYIMVICIDNEELHKGYGSKLLEHYLWNYPTEHWVKINKNNIASISLFQKFGFIKRWKKHIPGQLKPSYRTDYYPWFLPKRFIIDEYYNPFMNLM